MAAVHFGVVVGDLGFARAVAVKRIHPTLANDPGTIDSLKDEARLAARIRHPNVVSVLDVVATESELSIVLDYIHGESVSGLLRRAEVAGKSFPVGVCVAIAIDVLHGLHAAHTAVDEAGNALGIIHRDVSPQNILVGSDGVSRILDFGIAKAANRSQVTRDGKAKGKLAYMPPEQLGGDASVRSDVYALGIVLWQMLTGHLPFLRATTDSELLALVLKGVREPPSRSRSEVPALLDRIVMQAVDPAEDAESRYPSAQAMAQALEESGTASPRAAVGAFVDELAAESLEARRLIVSSLESNAPLPSLEGDPSPSRRTRSMTGAVVDIAPSPRRWVPILGIALLLLGAMIGATLLRLRRLEGATKASDRPPDTELVPPPAVGAATPSTSALAPPSADATASAPPHTVIAHPPGRVRRAVPNGSSRPPSCAVPYTVDSAGFRQYRRECFE